MTVQNACLVFILCFSGITGWLMLREPASISVAGTHEVKITSEKENSPVTPRDRDQVVRNRLNSVIIPIMDFRETTIEEAVDFLRLRTHELAPEDGSISFIVRQPSIDSEQVTRNLINLDAEEICLSDALDLICEKTEHRWEITADGEVLIFSTIRE